MCNFRKLWLLLALLLLLLLFILCIIIHTSSIYNEKNKPHNQPIEVQKTLPKPSKYALDDTISNTNIIKDNQGITISGLFGSQKSVDSTLEKFKLYFSPVHQGDIEIRDGVDDSKWADILDNMAYYFSNNIEQGKLKYSKDGLYISGETLNEGAQNDIQSILTFYQQNGTNTTSAIKVVEAKNTTQKTKKALYDLLHMKSIEFENGKSNLKQDAFALLDEVVAILRMDTNLHVTIEGHTDNTGNPALNQTLSLERAYAVRDYIVQKGISKEQIETKGYGETRPVLPNTTDENRQKNRRVEFKVKGDM